MKRITRQRSEETKRKISASLKGRAKSAQHKRAISVALKAYWETIPDSIDSGTNRREVSTSLHYHIIKRGKCSL